MIRSFRIRLMALSVLLSGATVVVFGMMGLGLVKRLSRDRLDGMIQDMAERMLRSPRARAEWGDGVVSGAWGDPGIVVLVRDYQGTEIYRTPNWPLELRVGEFPRPPWPVEPPPDAPPIGPWPDRRGPPEGRGPHGGRLQPPPSPGDWGISPDGGTPGRAFPPPGHEGRWSLEAGIPDGPIPPARAESGRPPDGGGANGGFSPPYQGPFGGPPVAPPGMYPPPHGPGGPPDVRGPVPVRPFEMSTREADGVRWRVGVFGNPEVLLAIGLNIERFSPEVATFQRALFLGLPIALGFVALGSWWLAQRALKPIEALTRTVERVSAKGLDQRITLEDADVEFRRLLQMFNEMMDRLERSFAQATRFSADAAHELKTPLTVLQGTLEQAVQQAPDGSREQQIYSGLLEEVQRLKTIVRKLLLLSLADAGRLTLHLQPLNLSEMLEGLCEDAAILGRGLSVRREVQTGLWVNADRDLLNQALQNMISNAVKYNRPKGEVRVQARHENGVIRVMVANTGPGIPPGDRAKVFDRFYRADQARGRSSESVGLGLSLARELLRAHGGDLALGAEIEGWTVFVATLPAGTRLGLV